MSLQRENSDPGHAGAPASGPAYGTTAPAPPAPPNGMTPPAPPYGGSAPYGAPAQQSTSVLAIVGLVLAFLAAPIGLVLSVIALFTTGARKKRGKGLAIAGVIVSLLVLTGAGIIVVKVGKTVSTLADPGCVTGKAAITDNASKLSDPANVQAGLQATVDGLKSAAGKAQHDNVRTAMNNLLDDYTKLQQAVTSGTEPDPTLQDKITRDAQAIDNLCTIGGAK